MMEWDCHMNLEGVHIPKAMGMHSNQGSGNHIECDGRWTKGSVYCAITALDGYPSHLDNIHYIQLATLIYALLPSMDHGHHFHLQHSSHPPFASGRHLFTPEPSHPSHVIGSSVTGTTIMSAHQEAQPCGSITFETSCGMWWKPRQWRF